jgi:hypothetical protein
VPLGATEAAARSGAFFGGNDAYASSASNKVQFTVND